LTTASDERSGRPAHSRRLAGASASPRVFGPHAFARARGVNHPAIQNAGAPTPERSGSTEGAIADRTIAPLTYTGAMAAFSFYRQGGEAFRPGFALRKSEARSNAKPWYLPAHPLALERLHAAGNGEDPDGPLFRPVKNPAGQGVPIGRSPTWRFTTGSCATTPRPPGWISPALARAPCRPRPPPTPWIAAPTWAKSRSGWGTRTCRPPGSTTAAAPGRGTRRRRPSNKPPGPLGGRLPAGSGRFQGRRDPRRC
jgi:hypothetical protein